LVISPAPTKRISEIATSAATNASRRRRRETPTLPTERRAQIYQSYFRFLPFAPTDLTCLALAEILAEKIRACYQRNNARDIYDLGIFATRPLDHALIRRLVVLKLWQARDTFDPARLMRKFEDGRDFDWEDLGQLLRRTIVVDRDRITARLRQGIRISRGPHRR